MNLTASHFNANEASALVRAMGNEHRLLMLCHLAQRERSVGELQELVGLQQSAVSQHLAKLRNDGLVDTRRDRQTIYYSLTSEAARAVLGTLFGLYGIPGISTSESTRAVEYSEEPG
jgi:DNA-binding transcriptional ArsR family regulator